MRKANISLAMAAVLILTGFTYLAIHSGVASQKLELKTIKLQSTEQKLNSINIQYEKLDTQLKTQSSTDQDKINDLKAQQEKLQQEKQDLESKLQAKADEKARLQVAAVQAEDALTATQTASAASAPSYSGSHTDWMAAAGISPNDYAAVDYIVSHESGWRVNAYNPSGATGLCQSLPASKMASAGSDYMTNPITQLRWCSGYATQRYGGWWGAYNFWINNHWW